jgi:protein associated with RNAse G/E
VAGREVRVVYTKYDGSLHWHHTARYLGEDDHGIWLASQGGSMTQRGNEPPIMLEQATVELMPRGTWWTATFNAAPVGTEIYCDITTPPRWPDESEVTMVDLDLDVVRLRADRQVLLLDEDEFAEHRVRYAYPAEVIARAEGAAAWLQRAIKESAEPFGTVYRGWLDQVG